MGEAEKRPATYVLQVQRTLPDVDGEAWVDAATVEVPANTRRKTAIKKALDGSGIAIGTGVVVRLLDADSAEGIPVRPKPPEAPQLEIG